MAPSTAWADAGEGLHAGNLSLSPGVTLSGGFDSNVFYLASQEGNVSSPWVKLVPFLKIETLESQFVNFNLNSQVGWQQYISTLNDVSSQSGLTADVGASAAFNESGAFSFRLEDQLTRTNEPPSEPSPVSYNRTLNRLGATIGIHPGGKVFQHYLSYDWMLYRHDELTDINRMIHDFTLKNYWRFLPKTAVVLSGDYQLVRYDTLGRTAGGFTNANSSPLRVTGGLTGLVTNRLAVRLVGGYGWAFYDAADTFKGLLVNAELQYMFGILAENNKLYLGYERNFQDTSIADFASFHRPYAGYEQGFANNRLRLSLKGEAIFRSYVGVPGGTYTVQNGTVTVPANLSDALIRGQAGVDFSIYKWWSISLDYQLSSNLTNDRITTTTPAGDVLREYVRHNVTFGTTIRY